METGRSVAVGGRTGLDTSGPIPGSRWEFRALRRGRERGKTMDLTEAAMEAALREMEVDGRELLVKLEVVGRRAICGRGAGP